MSIERRQFLASAAAVAGAASLSSVPLAASAVTQPNTRPNKQEKALAPNTLHARFTPENTALILVDHQVGTIGWAGELTNEEERNQLKMWTRVIARFAKNAGIPTILTSSLETEAQGPLLPEFKEIMPAEYEARIQRTGVINAWDDPTFVQAVRATGKKNLLMGGLTTDVCLVPPALSAKAAGFNVVALLDISAACTKIGAQNSRDLLQKAGIEIITVTPMITSMLGNYKNPAAGAFFSAFEKEGVFGAFAKGNLR